MEEKVIIIIIIIALYSKSFVINKIKFYVIIIIFMKLAEVITEESNLREENRRMSIMIVEAEEVCTCDMWYWKFNFNTFYNIIIKVKEAYEVLW